MRQDERDKKGCRLYSLHQSSPSVPQELFMQLQLMWTHQLIMPTLHCKVFTDSFSPIHVSHLDLCVRFPITGHALSGIKSDVPQLSAAQTAALPIYRLHQLSSLEPPPVLMCGFTTTLDSDVLYWFTYSIQFQFQFSFIYINAFYNKNCLFL